MKLFKGQEAEYKRGHDLLGPELRTLLRDKGIRDYSIFLDPATGDLIGVLQVSDPAALDHLPAEPVMQKWWEYMRDIMETHTDHSPVSFPLQEIFYMP